MALTLSIIALAGAVLLIRLGWGGRRYLAIAGWAVAALAVGWLTWADGAWGMATGLTAGAIFALVAVAYAGAVSPQRPVRRAVANPAVRLPGRHQGILRRLLVFLAVVPVSFLAAQWLAFAINAAMKGDAALNANSVSTMLMVQPVAWALLMVWQMVLDGPRKMLVPPVVVAGVASLIWVLA
ncbi:hypothetical protein [Alteriqipengyuania sp.]|uniref:hypothetical protein n=1 Tax=Alteriqipengyuania sp. TaxID=2800692 RepID=UPI0035122E59